MARVFADREIMFIERGRVWRAETAADIGFSFDYRTDEPLFTHNESP